MKRLAILLSALLWLQTAASGAEPWLMTAWPSEK